jgi:hypothetical protein
MVCRRIFESADLFNEVSLVSKLPDEIESQKYIE